MTYFTPDCSIRRWTSATWAETEADAVPIWRGCEIVSIRGVVLWLTGIRQKSARQCSGVGRVVVSMLRVVVRMKWEMVGKSGVVAG
jgi:hypothetical protein